MQHPTVACHRSAVQPMMWPEKIKPRWCHSHYCAVSSCLYLPASLLGIWCLTCQFLCAMIALVAQIACYRALNAAEHCKHAFNISSASCRKPMKPPTWERSGRSLFWMCVISTSSLHRYIPVHCLHCAKVPPYALCLHLALLRHA